MARSRSRKVSRSGFGQVRDDRLSRIPFAFSSGAREFAAGLIDAEKAAPR
jgi:hypothetical protein